MIGSGASTKMRSTFVSLWKDLGRGGSFLRHDPPQLVCSLEICFIAQLDPLDFIFRGWIISFSSRI